MDYHRWSNLPDNNKLELTRGVGSLILNEGCGEIVLERLLQMNGIFLALFGSGMFAVIVRTGNSIVKYYGAKTKRVNDQDKDLTEMKTLLEELATDNVEIKTTLRVHKRSNVSILHDKVYRNCREYLKIGYVTVEQLDNLEYLYSSYKEQGGNGTGDNLYNRVMELPIKD